MKNIRLDDALDKRAALIKQTLIWLEICRRSLSASAGNRQDFFNILTDGARRVAAACFAVCGHLDRKGGVRIDAVSMESDRRSCKRDMGSEISWWLDYLAKENTDQFLHLSRDKLDHRISETKPPPGLFVPNGVMAAGFPAGGKNKKTTHLLVVAHKEVGEFTTGDQALLKRLAEFGSLALRRHGDANAPESINQQLLTIIEDIPGCIEVVNDQGQEQTKLLETTYSKLKNQADENAANLYMTVTALEDEIDERRRIEEKLRLSQMQQRLLIRKTIETLENDRQAVAKELHDGIGASLAAIKFSIEETLAKMETAAASESLKKVIGYLVDTIKETKRISANLRPSTLDELGLLPTISWFCRKISEVYQDTQISQQIDIQEKVIPDELKIVIYRVLQEAVNNSLKHGAAANIKITLLSRNSEIELSIIDDGVGFDQGQQLDYDPISGHGIEGMRERVEICGGLLKLISAPGKGTCVRATIPAQLPGRGE